MVSSLNPLTHRVDLTRKQITVLERDQYSNNIGEDTESKTINSSW